MVCIELKDAQSGSSAKISPQRGFNCYEFRAVVGGDVVDVLDADPGFADGAGRESAGGIPILFPYPNRIREGRFTWDGSQYRLPPETVAYDPAGNAIHGFCLDRPWRVTAQGEYFAVGRFQLSVDAPDRRDLWPADFVIEIRYELRGPNLRADVGIVNPSNAPLPWGFGTHPYFRLPLAAGSDASRCLVEVPAAEQWELEDCLPTGRRVAVPPEKDLRDGAYFGTIRLDDVYACSPANSKSRAAESDTRLSTPASPAAGVHRSLDCLIMDEQAGLQVLERCDPVFREIVAYTPPGRDAVCLEPYTCVTDAVNLTSQGVDAGWRVLEPGGEFRLWIEIRAGRVIA